MFDMFSNELYASRSLIVDEKDQTSVFHVSKASIQGGTQSTPVWIVKSYTDLDVPRMECTCGQFEHMAMPCRHILKVPSFRIMHDCNSIMLHFVVLSVTITTLIVWVLVHTSAAVITAGNIHKRWTVTARDTGFAHPTIGVVGHLAVDDVAGRRNLLYLAAMDLMREGAVSNEGYKASMKALTEVKQALRVMREDPSDQSPEHHC
jgi:hypothetical protein